MPRWNDLRVEIEREKAGGEKSPNDKVRRKYLRELADHTGRPVVIYAVDFMNQTDKVRGAGTDLQIALGDKEGLVEVIESLPAGPLDLILHSPGGSAVAAESLVVLMRAKFDHVRVFVPNVAKSAATMIALSGNVIAIDEKGELGPTDPQFILARDQEQVVAPAQAILDEFARAQAEVTKEPEKLRAWIPVLRQYGPSLLAEANNAIDLSKQLVRNWLKQYMFAGKPDADDRALKISEFFGNHNNFGSHGRFVGLKILKEQGVETLDLQTDPALADKVWRAYTATSLTFAQTGAYKLIENSRGETWVKLLQQVALVSGPTLPGGTATPGLPVPFVSRAERRRRERGR